MFLGREGGRVGYAILNTSLMHSIIYPSVSCFFMVACCNLLITINKFNMHGLFVYNMNQCVINKTITHYWFFHMVSELSYGFLTKQLNFLKKHLRIHMLKQSL